MPSYDGPKHAPETTLHLIYWDGAANARVAFDNPQGLLTTSRVQRFGDGWLIVEGRGGVARIFDLSTKT